jgi:hypothetical protein
MQSLQGLFVLSLLIGGIAQAAPSQQSVTEAQYWGAGNIKNSRWYCVSESPSNPQSSGHIGYGHGRTRAESAGRAIEDCTRNGGFGCGAAQCFPE